MDKDEIDYNRQLVLKKIDDWAEDFYRRINYSPFTAYVPFCLLLAWLTGERLFASIAVGALAALIFQNIFFAVLFWRDKRMVKRTFKAMEKRSQK